MNYTTKESLFILNKFFDSYQAKPEETWKIMFNGNFIATCKGKSSWKKEHFARSAFKYLMYCGPLYTVHQELRAQNPQLNSWQNKPTQTEVSSAIKQLEECGILKFVKVNTGNKVI